MIPQQHLQPRRSPMSQSSPLLLGMDVHKETIAVAYVAQEHGAEGTYLGAIGTRQRPKFLRQMFVEWAAESRRHSFWVQVYYQQQRDKGKAHQAAARVLAFKWMRILYRCWQNRTP